MLDYPDGPTVTTSSLKGGKGRPRKDLEGDKAKRENGQRCKVIGFENGGRADRRQRMWTDPRKWKRQGDEFPPETPKKEHSPADTLILA